MGKSLNTHHFRCFILIFSKSTRTELKPTESESFLGVKGGVISHANYWTTALEVDTCKCNNPMMMQTAFVCNVCD